MEFIVPLCNEKNNKFNVQLSKKNPKTQDKYFWRKKLPTSLNFMPVRYFILLVFPPLRFFRKWDLPHLLAPCQTPGSQLFNQSQHRLLPLCIDLLLVHTRLVETSRFLQQSLHLFGRVQNLVQDRLYLWVNKSGSYGVCLKRGWITRSKSVRDIGFLGFY